MGTKRVNRKDGKHLNLTGKRFGRLVVLEESIRGEKERSHWICRCDCGNIVVVRGTALTSGNTKSCGCLNFENIKKRNFVDISGETFGLLTVTNEYIIKNRKRIWKCNCSCGNICWVPTSKLRNGHTKSCGCIRLSFGEEHISKILSQQNIAFVREYTFDDMRFDSGKLARFDFAVLDSGGNVSYLIEFDGQQHYEYSNKGWCTKEVYEKAKEHDYIKNKFCKNKNITLIRIPYFSLEEITINDLLLGSKYTVVNKEE